MPRVRTRGVNTVRKKLADGRLHTYHYHRATGTPLPGNPGSPEFVKAWLAAEEPPVRDEGTLAGLIRAYLSSAMFRLKAASTQAEYRRMLARIEEGFGDMPLRALESPKAGGAFLEWHAETGLTHPREADNRMRMLITLLNHAQKTGKIAVNPVTGFERLHKENRAEFIWTEAHLAKFMKDAPPELRQAMVLALHTGQRYGDLIRLTWAEYDGKAITLRQSKTGARVYIPATRRLREMLDGMERRGGFILTRADGRPWFTERNDKELSKRMRIHARSVGVSDLQFRDLRGTTVTLLSEVGASIPQIAAITGHTLRSAAQILEHYSARTKRLAEGAIKALEGSDSVCMTNHLQTDRRGTASGRKHHEQNQ